MHAVWPARQDGTEDPSVVTQLAKEVLQAEPQFLNNFGRICLWVTVHKAEIWHQKSHDEKSKTNKWTSTRRKTKVK